MKNRNRRTNNKGFTMAELMLAIAIIVILGALAMVGVTRYLRGLRLLEMDNAAKEIFYAAQNRITAELNSGTLGRLDRANELKADAKAASDRSLKAADGVTVVEFAAVHSSIASVPNPPLNETLLDELLPFGSIDDTLRGGGSYIITYSYDRDANMATVLDVWFASDEGSGFFRNWNGSESELLSASYDDLNKARTDNEKRRNFNNGTVIGYYGRTASSVTTLSELYNFHNLEFKLINDEVLYGRFEFQADQLQSTKVQNMMPSAIKEIEPQLKLTITQDNGAKLTLRYDVKDKKIVRFDDPTREITSQIVKDVTGASTDKLIYLIVLDDITETVGERFRDLVAEPDSGSIDFTLGKDIHVNIEVYTNAVLANIDSVTAVDNSLFQYVKTTKDDLNNETTEAGIGKIRHLQNLSNNVSGVALDSSGIDIDIALQTTNLYWQNGETGGFVNFKLSENEPKIGGDIVYNTSSTTTEKTSNYFYPIDLKASDSDISENGSFLTYTAEYTVKERTTTSPRETDNYKISNLVVGSGDKKTVHAGLFGTVTNVKANDSITHGKHLLAVEHLVMENATVIGSTTAAVVLANEENAAIINDVTIDGATVTASSGVAGGVVGKAVNGLDLSSIKITGTTTVTASGHAGGLIGEFGDKVDDSHMTVSGIEVGADKEGTNGEIIKSTISVTSGSAAGTAAGGLVGSITNGLPTISDSYSTATVNGAIAGGLVGTIAKCDNGSSIASCYVGGHTVDAKYATEASNCNVQSTAVADAAGTAGGFIGSVGADVAGLGVSTSYSTASASGHGAGGFIGDVGANISINKCYAVGLVKDTEPAPPATQNDPSPSGAFIGNITSGKTLSGGNNLYLDLVNEGMSATGAVAGTGFSVTYAESSLETYSGEHGFIQLGKEEEFFPFDPMLTSMFKTRYFLPTVKDLGGSESMNTHVGDWQPVDTLVFNSTT